MYIVHNFTHRKASPCLLTVCLMIAVQLNGDTSYKTLIRSGLLLDNRDKCTFPCEQPNLICINIVEHARVLNLQSSYFIHILCDFR